MVEFKTLSHEIQQPNKTLIKLLVLGHLHCILMVHSIEAHEVLQNKYLKGKNSSPLHM